MRAVPPRLAARLEGGATTLCRCWALRRRDGLVLGFTDHDRDLVLGGVTYAARSGLEAAEASAELGFAIGGGEVAGALTSAGITEADVAAGLYDGAGVETWLVDWAEPEARLLLDVATLGEIRREGGAFVAELRGLMHRLDVTIGRSFRAACDAELGDARCRVDLSDPRFRATGTVRAASEPGRLSVALAGAFTADWFSGGRLTWDTGANAGHAADLRGHRRDGDATILDLWDPPPRPVVTGDAFTLVAGCDKCARIQGLSAFIRLNGANSEGVYPQVPPVFARFTKCLQPRWWRDHCCTRIWLQLSAVQQRWHGASNILCRGCGR